MTKFTLYINLVTALALIGVIFLPLWSIELTAPQYPEGLVMKIYADKLGGDVDVVNGLNHYIGMRTLHAKDFAEFAILPYIIGVLVFFGLLSFFINRRWFFLAWVAFYLIFAVTAMIDFYRWEYNYGHNLDPTAPIQVPGMAYQPPLIGFKQLLNFGVYSIPDTGGWIFIGVAVLMMAAVWLEWKNWRKKIKPVVPVMLLVPFCTVLLSSCIAGPRPVKAGSDACTYCKMTVTDLRFSTELVTGKGKTFVFDDYHCLRQYMKGLGELKDAQCYFMDYTGKGGLLPAEQLSFLQDSLFHSPMGGNLAAFGNTDSLRKYQEVSKATVLDWKTLSAQ